MIRLLKQLLDWLDRRFPAKVTITQDAIDAMNTRDEYCEHRVGEQAKAIYALSGKVLSLEKSIAAIKDTLSKNGNLLVKSDADKLRDNFVQSGFVRNNATE